MKKTTVQIKPIIFLYPNVSWKKDGTVDLPKTHERGFCGCGKPIAFEDCTTKYCKDCWEWLEERRAKSRKENSFLYIS